MADLNQLLAGIDDLEVFGEGTAGTAYTLTAETGSFGVSGQPAALLAGRRLRGDAGSLAVGGADVGLLVGWRLIAETGSVGWAGSPAILTYTSESAIDPIRALIAGAMI